MNAQQQPTGALADRERLRPCLGMDPQAEHQHPPPRMEEARGATGGIVATGKGGKSIARLSPARYVPA